MFVAPTPVSGPTVNDSSYDISQHFCRLYRHASTYADGKIYIDGGNTYVPNGNGTFYSTAPKTYKPGMNNNLIVLDLSQNFTNQDTFPYSSIHKGPDVPSSLIEHALWYSACTRRVYQLGGWFSSNNVNDPGYRTLPQIPESAIWAFDIDRQTWSSAPDISHVNPSSKLDRPGAASYCDAPSINTSFIFEGYVQQRSDQDYIKFNQNSDFKFIEGMLALDTRTSQPILTNISVPQKLGSRDVGFGPRMNGAMVHVPIGPQGILVMLGGQMTTNPTDYGVRIPGANAGNTNIPLDFVDIYDIESGYWFRQTTFGIGDGIPSGRSDICAVVVPAKDNSSFNIYMVAGLDSYKTYISSEEIWVLTLPTFQWTLINSRSDGMYGHTCHVVGESLLVIGGMQTLPDGGDTNACSTHMPAEIFSLTTQKYTGAFDAAGAKRLAPVPSKVVEAIGGTGNGGAYITAPKVWSDLYLQYVFNPSLSRPAYTPSYTLANVTGFDGVGANNSTTSTSSGPNIGIIVGATLGGIAVVLLGVVLVFFNFRHRKQQAVQEINRQSVTSELPAYSQEVKHENAPAFRGMTSLPVTQINGPAELHTGYPFHHIPRHAGQTFHSPEEAQSPLSVGTRSLTYSLTDDPTEIHPRSDDTGRSVSPQAWTS